MANFRTMVATPKADTDTWSACVSRSQPCSMRYLAPKCTACPKLRTIVPVRMTLAINTFARLCWMDFAVARQKVVAVDSFILGSPKNRLVQHLPHGPAVDAPVVTWNDSLAGPFRFRCKLDFHSPFRYKSGCCQNRMGACLMSSIFHFTHWYAMPLLCIAIFSLHKKNPRSVNFRGWNDVN